MCWVGPLFQKVGDGGSMSLGFRIGERASLGRSFMRPIGQRIFCVGLNKTGTTSLKRVLEDRFGQQRLETKTFPAFDLVCPHGAGVSGRFVQFSVHLPPAMDMAFPDNRLILTVRDCSGTNPSTWYHGNLWGEEGRIETKGDLETASYPFTRTGRNRMLYDNYERNSRI